MSKRLPYSLQAVRAIGQAYKDFGKFEQAREYLTKV
jgi:hypothetical protein